MEQIQFISCTPQQLQEEIQKGIKSQLEDFLKHFTPQQPNDYLTRQEVAELFKVDLSTVHNWCKSGKLKPLGIGARVYFLRADIDNCLIPLNKDQTEIVQQFKGVEKKSNISITRETPLNNTNISKRAFNALKANSDKFESIKGLDFNKSEVTVGHFEGLKKNDLERFRNIGKKSIAEIEKMFSEAGIILM